jgi:hypothetical protein
VHTPETDATLARLRDALQGIAQGARELERAAREAAALAETLSGGGQSAETGAGNLDPRQAALLVAVTLRGGTVDADAFSALAARLEIADAAAAELFAGADPHLVRRAASAACVTERGLEAAAAWRAALPEGLWNVATGL